MIKKRISYKEVAVFLTSTFFCFLLSSTFKDYGFLSLSFYISLSYLGFNLFLGGLSFVISLLFINSLSHFILGFVACAFLSIIFWIYKKKNKKPNAELIVYSAISLSLFLFIKELDLTYKLISFVLSILAVFVFISALRVIFIKNFNYKINTDEKLCLSVLVILLEFGFINSLSFLVLKSINIFIILSSLTLLKDKSSFHIITVLSIAPCFFEGSLNPLSLYVILGVVANVFIKNSKLLSCFLIILTDLTFMLFSPLYPNFYYMDIFYTIAPVCLFLFIPNNAFEEIKLKISSYKDKVLTKQSITRIRSSIAGKLFLISDVFSEMQQSFGYLKNSTSSNDDLLFKMCDEIVFNVCEKCPSYSKCKRKSGFIREELYKIFSVGIAKNRVSLIDLTKHFTENCGFINGIICEMNALITKYREKVKENDDLFSGKQLLQLQSQGVSEVLKGLALDFSKSLNFNSELERKISENLHRNGIVFNEILIFGSLDNIEINLILNNKFINDSELLNGVSEVLGKSYSVISKTSVSYNVSSITLKASPVIDVAFGLSFTKKDGSTISGDTHSLLKIDEGKFLVALSDGMGSGRVANSTSTTAISLIESLYKVGLDSNLILNMVNKVLTLNTDDNFSAIDILSVNLFSLTADFIKIGAPYSFILTDSCVKIVEGNSLPLGILDDLTPNSCTFSLEEGSSVIMMTDGVSDAFSSSTDLIDFLRTLDNRNPQNVTDTILKHALNLQSDIAKDDMTVLCIRVFKKAS